MRQSDDCGPLAQIEQRPSLDLIAGFEHTFSPEDVDDDAFTAKDFVDGGVERIRVDDHLTRRERKTATAIQCLIEEILRWLHETIERVTDE